MLVPLKAGRLPISAYLSTRDTLLRTPCTFFPQPHTHPRPPPNIYRSQVGVHVLAPAEALAADPLPDAVAVMQLAVAASAHRAGGVKLPEGAGRLAVFVDGTESDADLATLKVRARITPPFNN